MSCCCNDSYFYVDTLDIKCYQRGKYYFSYFLSRKFSQITFARLNSMLRHSNNRKIIEPVNGLCVYVSLLWSQVNSVVALGKSRI